MKKMMTLAGALVVGIAHAGALPSVDGTVARESWAVKGNSMRFASVLGKLEKGEPVTLGVIGGSITEGAGSSSGSKKWAELVAAGLRTRFPQSTVKLVNAGIGATGSDIGTFRIRRDLLSKNPDLVVIEFSVNDGSKDYYGETYEGCLRQMLGDLPQTAVIALGMTDSGGKSSQSIHAGVCAHYQVPFVSYRDVVWPLVTGGKVLWTDIAADGVHPNDTGHAFAADLVLARLDAAFDEWKDAGRPSWGSSPLPDALYGTRYEKGVFMRMNETKILQNDGFSEATDAYWGKGLACSLPGKRLSFEVTGSTVAFLYRSGKSWGKIKVTVDGVVVKPELDCFADVSWWWTPSVFILQDQPGTHTVEIETLNEKNADSTGYGCNLSGLLVADAAVTVTRWNWFRTRLSDWAVGETPSGEKGAVGAVWDVSELQGSDDAVICEKEYRKVLDCSLMGRLSLTAKKERKASSQVEIFVEHDDPAAMPEERLAWQPPVMAEDDRAGCCIGYSEGIPSAFGYTANGWRRLVADGFSPTLPSDMEWRISLQPMNEGMNVSYAVKLNGTYVDLKDDQGNMWFPCKGAARFWDTVQFSGGGMVAQVGATCRPGLTIVCR